MGINVNIVCNFGRHICVPRILRIPLQKYYHGNPFLDFYEKTTGQKTDNDFLSNLKKKHPNIDSITNDRLQCTLQVLEKFGISALEACQNIHVFSMNPISVDNYGEILKECGFIKIAPISIIRYHTIVRSRTIAYLKSEGLIRQDFMLEENLYNSFKEWPANFKVLQYFAETKTSILTVRMYILEKYLNWALSVTSEEFNKYCRYYLPLKHKPMSDIQEALDLAQNEIKFNKETIKRNGFIISSDPINTKLLLGNVPTLAGYDIREALRIEPAIMKNNYNSLLKIRDLIEEYRIPKDAQQRCLKVYCMCPETVQKRLEELKELKEYQILSTNPRVLWLVVHKNKMMSRLTKIQAAKKQCYSLNHLVASSKVFNDYISSFGEKICGRDIATLITSSLQIKKCENLTKQELLKTISNRMKRHKYWLHSALSVIDKNLQFLKKRFDDEIILNNCQLLLYPVAEVENHINCLLNLREGKDNERHTQDTNFNNLNHSTLTDDHLLSLVLYEIERKYHFSGDGIWTRLDGGKLENECVNR